MKLKVPRGDARTGRPSVYGQSHTVVDLESGKTVGHLYKRRGFNLGEQRIPTWAISLFNGQFEGKYESWEECVAFAAGVERVMAILERMLSGEKLVIGKESDADVA